MLLQFIHFEFWVMFLFLFAGINLLSKTHAARTLGKCHHYTLHKIGKHGKPDRHAELRANIWKTEPVSISTFFWNWSKKNRLQINFRISLEVEPHCPPEN